MKILCRGYFMKIILAILLMITFVYITFSACVATSSQTTEPQETINDNNAITESEVEAFFSDDDEFAAYMLINPAEDMTNLKDIMLMILYPLGASHDKQVSFSEFNSYTMKYLNRSYPDNDFEIFATEETVPGINVNMSKQTMYLSGMGGADLVIEGVKIIEDDTAQLTCSWGFSRYEPDLMDEVLFNVQFGRTNSQLYIISISRLISHTSPDDISLRIPMRIVYINLNS